MTATEFLRKRNIVAEDKTDLIIGFDNGTKESLIELLDSYYELKLNRVCLTEATESVCVCINWHSSTQSNQGKKAVCSNCNKIRKI